MTLAGEQVVSAQVILKSAAGRAPAGPAAITAATVKEILPSPDAVAQATTAFRREGFQVGDVVGNSFSITAPTATFERVFRTKLRRDARGAVEPVSASAADRSVLPDPAVPPAVAGLIAAVTFTPPPDFGPTNFGP